ncbi:MAG TPA: hypothetical protein PK663_06630, partial [Spirochaetota bacterium]|nr:hypothetical protein [Spirochaetota bacterium]
AGSEEIASAAQEITAQVESMTDIVNALTVIVKGKNAVSSTGTHSGFDTKKIQTKQEGTKKLQTKTVQTQTKTGTGGKPKTNGKSVHIVKPEEEIPFDNLDDF